MASPKLSQRGVSPDDLCGWGDTIAGSTRAYKSTHRLLILTPAHYFRVALPSQPDYYSTCHSLSQETVSQLSAYPLRTFALILGGIAAPKKIAKL